MLLQINLPSETALRSFALSCSLIPLVAFEAAFAEEPLVMAFRDKPPYSYVENGTMKGFLLERTRAILDRSKLAYQFVEMPPKRIFMEIEANRQRICSFGWYLTPEREAYGKYSRSIHRDRPHLVLAGKHAESAVHQHSSLKSLLGSTLGLAVVDGVSYGPDIDRMIATFPGKVDKSLQPPVQVARKVALGRADFMFMDREDYDYLMQSDLGFRSDALVQIGFPDMPPGLKRYILCSRQVSDAEMAELNAAIAATAGTLP